jgi:predicted CoA-binding protein
VNPRIESALGEKSYPTLGAAVEAVPDIALVNVFRASSYVPEIVKDAIRLQIPYLWLQEGVIDEEAAALAEAVGIKVVMDRCILKDRMAAGWELRAQRDAPMAQKP